MGLLGVLLRLRHDLGHQLELRRMRQPHVRPVPRHEQDDALGDADGLLVARCVGVAHVDGQPPRVALLLDDREEVGERLVGVVPVTLHVEDGDAARLCHRTDVGVPDPPVDVSDRDAVVVAAEDLPDLLPSVTVTDLGARRVEEHRVAPELRHPRLEARPGAGAREEEQHREDLVPEEGVRFPERPAALEVHRHIEDRVEFVLRPFLGGDHVASVQMGLHQVLLGVCSMAFMVAFSGG